MGGKGRRRPYKNSKQQYDTKTLEAERNLRIKKRQGSKQKPPKHEKMPDARRCPDMKYQVQVTNKEQELLKNKWGGREEGDRIKIQNNNMIQKLLKQSATSG